MAFCAGCGKEIPDHPDIKFCPRCGKEKNKRPPVQPPGPYAAPPLSANKLPPSGYKKRPISEHWRDLSNRDKGLVVGVGIILLIIIIVAAVGENMKETNNTVETETTTDFETIGMFDNSPAMIAISYYGTNPTKADITDQCNEMKSRFIDSGITTNLRISFFDDRANTPDYSGGYDIPESSQPFEVANYFYNANNSQTRLLFLKPIP